MPHGKRILFGVIGVVALLAALSLVYFATLPSREQVLRRVRLAMAERNFALAENLAQAAVQRFPSDPEVLLIAAEVAARDQRWAESLERYEQVVSDQPAQKSSAAYGRGEACVQLGRFERAEREFRLAVAIDPQADLALRRLVDVLIFTGRRHRAAPWLERVIPTPRGTLEDLFHLGDLDHLVSRPPSVWAATAEPDADPFLVLGAGFQALSDGRNQEAVLYFERVVKQLPNDPDAQAGWGQALLETNSDRLHVWQGQLTSAVLEDPGILAVLGQLASQRNQNEQAVRLFALVVKLQPTSRIAWHRLGISLRRVGKTAESELALTRAEVLQVLGTRLNDLFGQRQNLILLRRVAEQLAGMGRFVEATAWLQQTLTVSPDAIWAKRLLERIRNSPESVVDATRETELRQLLTSLAVPAKVDGSRVENATPIRGESKIVPESGTRDGRDAVRLSRIRFVDVARETGLDFVHHAARDASTPGARIIETTGGGVGVVDYDGDGWPDLYLTQGDREFPLPEPNPDLDRLFRNLEGQAWIDVSLLARLEDVQFGQGIAVGDFNNDGFADLYVANYGFNVLYQNQGDGTFLDVTPASFRQEKVWTSSCVIADLNDDGSPDLFDVTYCRGKDVETRMCRMQGVSRSCSPRVFGAEPDRFWRNDGAGGWEQCPAGLNLPQGFGLGVLAFRPNSESRLGLFVANDETPNYWLVNSENKSGAAPVWEDRASSGGLAVDAEGQAQACMGIACDDVNGDGLPDLYVTNFYQESNTLYLAATSDFFEDRTRDLQLRQPSWNRLGFGTQFLDADLDGWPDLLVANGHVDDLSTLGISFQMSPQCFQNRAGIFLELTSSEAGECFAQPALGRGLARLDWNRDGREDAVIVNQESPVVLLTNVSEKVGHSLTLQFRATQGARDAIGTIVRVRIGSRILTRQITAGDGYQASNERQLVIGTGAATTVDGIEVDWPDGSRHRLGSFQADQRYLVIQDHLTAMPL